MKTVLSVPDELFKKAEALARFLGISRDELYRRAIARFVEVQDSATREALNKVYSKKSNRDLDPMVRAASDELLANSDW